MSYKLVLGLEIHLHVNTKTKMFCNCSADIYDAAPNTHTCPVCLGLPGALPVPNLDAIKKAQILGLALNCKLNENSKFDRKHYFYPDLPKGYQISQYKEPLCIDGEVLLSSGKRVVINRLHIEEDTAKSFHEGDETFIDFNMSSMPLIEIVTAPCFNDVGDAVEFCKLVQTTVRDLGLGDVDMEKGQMRLEPNISLRTLEMEEKNALNPYKVEIKNINSFRFMEKAVSSEFDRQSVLLSTGEMPIQENRGYVEAKNSTVSQRSKEDAHDYRYFPEPDIPPMVFDSLYRNEIEIEFKHRLASSSTHIKLSMLSGLGLKPSVLSQVVSVLSVESIKLAKESDNFEKAVVLMLNRVELRDTDLVTLNGVLNRDSGSISDEGLLMEEVNRVLAGNASAVENYKAGKEASLMFLVGEVMKATRGKANPKVVRDLVAKMIKVKLN